MSDPYRIDQRPKEDTSYARFENAAGSHGADAKAGGSVSTMLWVIAAVCAGLNSAFSVAGQDVLGGLFGGLAGVSLIALLVRYLHRRKR